MDQNVNAVERIEELCKKYGYSYYELAKRSNLTYSTLNTMILKKNSPSLGTLVKICDGFGITLAQFFNDSQIYKQLTDNQMQCLKLFTALSPESQSIALAFLQGLSQTHTP